MQEYIVDGHEPSLLPDGKQWKLVWNDEFDGTFLDESKWMFRRHISHRKLEHLTGAEGLEFDGKSCVKFKLLRDGDQFRTSYLQTGVNFMDMPPDEKGCRVMPAWQWPIGKFQAPKFLHKYGYYECRCKLQKCGGWWSAFWLQSPVIGAGPDPERYGVEVDIMEYDADAGVVEHNNHWNGYGPDHQHIGKILEPLADDGFHVFGLEWTPEAYVYYVDGRETWRVTSPVSQTEAFVLLDIECRGYRKNGKPSPLLFEADPEDCFTVDYVRVYDEVPR